MYEYGEVPGLEEFAEGLMEMNLAGNVMSMLWGIISYVFMAIGMYTIAKRRGINFPWLAWLPFGSSWMLGCISDEYRYVVKGQEKSKRKLMLGLDIAVSVLAVVMIGVLIAAIVFIPYGAPGSTAQWARTMGLVMVALGLCLVMLGLAITLMVLRYMALYDLFASCNPETATVFTALSIVLSLFGSSILPAIFVFATRNKDIGMPPRYQQIYVEQVSWRQQEPPVEPWELDNDH
jgi:hypothetical protein